MADTSLFQDYFDDLKVVFVGKFKHLSQGLFVKRDYLRIGLMTGDAVTKKTKEKTVSTHCPILFFNFPHEEYCWTSERSAPRNSYFFDITGKRASSIEKMLRKDFPEGFIHCHDPLQFQLILDKMYESFFNHRPQKRYYLPMFAEEFLTGIYVERSLAESTNKYEKIILAHADLVHKDPAAQHDFNANAAKLQITSIHYRRLFKSVIGMPPYEYLQHCRLLLAINLLKTSKSLQIKQISLQCGFSSSTEFSRFFKKQTGISPVNYCKKVFE